LGASRIDHPLLECIVDEQLTEFRITARLLSTPCFSATYSFCDHPPRTAIIRLEIPGYVVSSASVSAFVQSSQAFSPFPSSAGAVHMISEYAYVGPSLAGSLLDNVHNEERLENAQFSSFLVHGYLYFGVQHIIINFQIARSVNASCLVDKICLPSSLSNEYKKYGTCNYKQGYE
jgi:hypothetical protein